MVKLNNFDAGAAGHLVKEPGELGGGAGAGADAVPVVAVQVDLLGPELLGDVAAAVVERQPAAVSLVHLGTHHQQGDADLQ